MQDETWVRLFERLPVAWWEADAEHRITARGGGAASEAARRGPFEGAEHSEPSFERRLGPPDHDVDAHRLALAG